MLVLGTPQTRMVVAAAEQVVSELEQDLQFLPVRLMPSLLALAVQELALSTQVKVLLVVIQLSAPLPLMVVAAEVPEVSPALV